MGCLVFSAKLKEAYMGTTFYEILNILGTLLSIFGLIVLGVSLTWLLVNLLHHSEITGEWQKVCLVIGFLAFGSTIFWLVGQSGAGGFALGAGFGLLFFGMFKPQSKKQEKPDEVEEIS
jgi:hypothetical protein